MIILKARQQGLSTYTGGYLYHAVSQQPARKAMVLRTTLTSTRALFDMTKRYHENCPEILRPTPSIPHDESCLSTFFRHLSSLLRRVETVLAVVRRYAPPRIGTRLLEQVHSS